MDHNQILSVLSNIEEVVKATIILLEETNEDLEIPVLKDVKSITNLYDFYRNSVMSYNRICNRLSQVSVIQIRLRQLRNEVTLSGNGILPSLQKTVKYRVEQMLAEIETARQGVLYQKEKLDAQLRFYGSVQYMLTSNKYNEMNY